MDKLKLFENVSRTKILSAIDHVSGRKTVVWGASDSGLIVKRLLQEYGFNQIFFVDKNADKIKRRLGVKG